MLAISRIHIFTHSIIFYTPPCEFERISRHGACSASSEFRMKIKEIISEIFIDIIMEINF